MYGKTTAYEENQEAGLICIHLDSKSVLHFHWPPWPQTGQFGSILHHGPFRPMPKNRLNRRYSNSAILVNQAHLQLKLQVPSQFCRKQPKSNMKSTSITRRHKLGLLNPLFITDLNILMMCNIAKPERSVETCK